MKYQSLEKMIFLDTSIAFKNICKEMDLIIIKFSLCILVAGRLLWNQWNKNFENTCWRLRLKCLSASLILSRMSRVRNPTLTGWTIYETRQMIMNEMTISCIASSQDCIKLDIKSTLMMPSVPTIKVCDIYS